MSTLLQTRSDDTASPLNEDALRTALRVIRRDGATDRFAPAKIAAAMTKAFLAVEGRSAAGSPRVHDLVAALTQAVVAAVERRAGRDHVVHIEDIQDQVELALMRGGHHKVARAYVLYREERALDRQAQEAAAPAPVFHLASPDGTRRPIDLSTLARRIEDACKDLSGADAGQILSGAMANLYDGMSVDELADAPILAARSLVETDPDYAYASARLLLTKLAGRVSAALGVKGAAPDLYSVEGLSAYLRHGVSAGLIDPELLAFDLPRLAAALRPERDRNFQLLGLQTLYDRYLLQADGRHIEMPQTFFMRVAMGLARQEVDREGSAIAFYDLLSSFRFMASTPTLFNAGTPRPQLSSCFLTTIGDDLSDIFKSIRDNALLAKYSGGLGNDWTNVRGLGAHIRGTNGKSQGVVPFLKVANDTAIAVNQGGKRKGAVCAYLESWHIDIEAFLDLRKNTGDDRRRTHDMNTANWVPDLFMQRMEADESWTLFSPDEVPELHDSYGPAFKTVYEAAEARAERGELRVHRKVRAVDLWRRMLTMLFETGHPWITFKDACNIRSPQRHVGTIHSSNLCTEITLNTSGDEVAVCNLGSVNLAAHVSADGGLDEERLAQTVRVAMRMLDNVIDINFYTIPEARRSNLAHRPVGLGLMGFQDALHIQRIPYASEAAVTFADTSMEAIAYHAIAASSALAAERGRYPSFEGSLWSQGILPPDSLALLAEARGTVLPVGGTRDWDSLRETVRRQGMRNSNCMAIAPTATISNICGVSQSIEPTYQNLFVKANMSGDFTVANPYLVRDLKERGLWDAVMISDLKYYDGALAPLDRVDGELKALYATAFEIDSQWLLAAAARRQTWLDQAQSLNLYLADPSGRALDTLYRTAWKLGLKTTYYLRTRSASHVEKSTLDVSDGRLNAVPVAVRACAIDEPDCEACQ
ncbi:ribonucleoside-diphosphate reductase subunit alpha [Aureimonas frigidaquae]|uniref:Ribonucleoside-diphosphate reductase n=1 Tax=Aureimonas frigidaquae TaxID=424757 RepID=A0A0P0Z3R3_9HYPH|nr:ribonucleoside-diphosphate reductase subunit alpha [Aureimonas frigidaquae]BAT28758.1 ribonucleotide-diphosphate reductase subunit alpha [Aureimonas frigidaquae]